MIRNVGQSWIVSQGICWMTRQESSSLILFILFYFKRFMGFLKEIIISFKVLTEESRTRCGKRWNLSGQSCCRSGPRWMMCCNHGNAVFQVGNLADDVTFWLSMFGSWEKFFFLFRGVKLNIKRLKRRFIDGILHSNTDLWILFYPFSIIHFAQVNRKACTSCNLQSFITILSILERVFWWVIDRDGSSRQRLWWRESSDFLQLCPIRFPRWDFIPFILPFCGSYANFCC